MKLVPVCSLCLKPEERPLFTFAKHPENCSRCKAVLTIGQLPVETP